MRSENEMPVAVIGAGPYGLSIAAHLSRRGIPCRVFGRPMRAWRSQMPKGMFLKSEVHATNLSDPDGELTLEEFCRREGHAYRHFGLLPIPLDLFSAYGMAFQQRLVPHVEEVDVTHIRGTTPGFAVTLADGAAVRASRVVVAVGCDPFRRLPPSLMTLGGESLSHSADHRDFARFNGKRVCVVGAGASATDVAAALHVAGARVHLVSRAERLLWVSPRIEMPRFPNWAKLDMLGGGRFGQGYLFSQLPQLYRYLPAAARTHFARTYLGPRGGWPVHDCVKSLPKSLGASIERAEEGAGPVTLHLRLRGGYIRPIRADHVIAATGYKIDLDRMEILAADLRKRITTSHGAPELSSGFESSVPGLYFAGFAAVHSFGPLMRFVAGTDFAARRIASAVASSLSGDVRHAARSPAAMAAPSLRTYVSPESE